MLICMKALPRLVCLDNAFFVDKKYEFTLTNNLQKNQPNNPRPVLCQLIIAAYCQKGSSYQLIRVHIGD